MTEVFINLMRVFKNKWFARYARQLDIDDTALCEAVRRATQGIIDADLGGGVVKQRVARPGSGNSGGFRTVIIFRVGEVAFFVYGFAKSARGNIGSDELKAFKTLASEMLAYDKDFLAEAVKEGALTEVTCDEKAI